jgi:hypothetical protein
MDQNSDLPSTGSVEPGAVAPGIGELAQNQLVQGKKGVQNKRTFSNAPHELAGKLSEVSSGYTKSQLKDALTMVASLHGLRLVPVGIALKTPEPAKAAPAIKQRKDQRNSPSLPSLNQACKSNPQYVALEEERLKVIYNLKNKVGGDEAQGPLKVQLQDLSHKVKTLRDGLREEISSKAVQKST